MKENQKETRKMHSKIEMLTIQPRRIRRNEENIYINS